jgi:YegS/Rv2252/BmrU family lipid kinase
VETSRSVPRQAALVINAHSRKGENLFQAAKAKLRAAGIELTHTFPVKHPSKLVETMRQAVRSGAPMVIVGGGDGSISCTVDEIVDRDVVFALLPLGTANSFARTLGIPLDLDGAIDVIANGQRRRIDLGMIDGDYFANCAAIGLSPMIGKGIPHNLKKYLGRFGYALWASWCFAHFKHFELRVMNGTTEHRMSALEVRVCNGRFHGGVEVVEDTDVDSEEIVVQVVTGRVKRRLAWNWLATYFRLPSRKESTIDIRGKRLEISTDPPLPISIDGEVLAHTPATCAIAERAIEIMVPR